jgi:hypothetical protein
MKARPRRPFPAAFVGAALALAGATGCDIIQGLGNAGRAIFPEDATYVDAPGSRLAAGNYAGLDFAGVWLGRGTIGFKLLARSVTPGDDSLAVIGFTDGSVCHVDHVGAYRSSSVAGSGEVMLAYLDGPGPRGTLRFADPDCQLLPAVVPDAALSSATMADGRRIVVSGNDLVLVDAAGGAIEPFEPDVERVLTRSDGPYLVQAGGRLSVYDEDWRLQARLGEGVTDFGYMAFSSRIIFEDQAGIWTASAGGDVLPVRPGACGLGFSAWQPLFITFQWPCGEGNAVAHRPDQVETLDLGPDIDSRHAEFWMEGAAPNRKLWVAHFRDFDEAEALGTLLLRSEDGRDVVLGERAAPEWINPSSSGSEGFALLNVHDGVGDFARFDTSGSVRVLADRALRSNDGIGMIAHFDGVAGDMGGIDDLGRFIVMLPRVPRDGYTYLNQDVTACATLNDFDGRTGTLSRCTKSFMVRTPVATRVLHPHHGFIDSIFPGMAWIRADAGGDTGTLEYDNSDLVYTATVSEGVASFLQTTEGLVYSVPHGAGAGVWFAEAK